MGWVLGVANDLTSPRYTVSILSLERRVLVSIGPYFLGKFGGDVKAFLLADVVQDGDDLVDGGRSHSHAQTTRPDGGNHFRRRVGA